MKSENELGDAKITPNVVVEPLKTVADVRQFKPLIDIKKCSKNYKCLIFCPKNAITANKSGFPVIDYNICDGCLICLRECPVAAISEERE